MNTMKPKYQLPGKDGGFFYRDDKQLRRSFRPWLRWLPTLFLWKLACYWYYNSKPIGKVTAFLYGLIALIALALVGIVITLFTGLYTMLEVYLIVVLVLWAFYMGAVIAS
jgi:hypothetical protein